MAPMNRLGTLILFHLRQDGKPLSHGVSFTAYPNAELSEAQILTLANNDSAMLRSSALIELVGSCPAPFTRYANMKDEIDRAYYCPQCNPMTKGTENG